MAETTVLDSFWDLIGGVLTLNPEIVETISALPRANLLAVILVLAAGLSMGIAQGIVLFANRVKPIRFVFSLLIGTALFFAGYSFWVFSTWLVSLWLSEVTLSLGRIAQVLGYSYAPLIFSFFGALPYLGPPILQLLSVWNLLAMDVGFSAITDLSAVAAARYVLLGWVVLQILQQTVGQPIAATGRWIANRAAGVNLVTNPQELSDLVQSGVRIQTTPESIRGQAAALYDAASAPAAAASADKPLASPLRNPPMGQGTGRRRFGLNRTLQRSLQFLGLALLTMIVLTLLSPWRDWLFQGASNRGGLVQWVFDLIWLGLIGLIVSGLLAPLEALGWWAGWYGDNLAPRPISVAAATNHQAPLTRRYVVYLDGIGQSTRDYQPSVANFLNRLAALLPKDMQLVKGLMSYSVLNRSLTEDRLLSPLWRWAEQLQLSNRAAWIGLLVNIRNVLIVAVSADQRYGPIYNQGVAQQIYDSLIHLGYPATGGIPITLIGYSGGGQIAMGALPFLKRTLQTTVEVISLGGVISGNVRALEVEQLYHLVGERDTVERVGPILFPRRWPLSTLSYWNRAKRKGRISLISLGRVGHQVPGGILDPNAVLPDGRSHLQQTLDFILDILQGNLSQVIDPEKLPGDVLSNYRRYQQADYNQWDYYPLTQSVDLSLYRPIAPWMGRLVLPEADLKSRLHGVLFEVHHAPQPYQALVGQTVRLQRRYDPRLQQLLQLAIKDVHFSAEAAFSQHQGLVHPARLNHWRRVDPLESLAGSHPIDDVMVALLDPVEVINPASFDSGADADPPGATLLIGREPIQISGRYYGLVKFLGPVGPSAPDHFRVAHFNPVTREFAGADSVVYAPTVVTDRDGFQASSNRRLEASPLNDQGWYIYGAQNRAGVFVVTAIAPRSLLRLQPHRVISSARAGARWIKKAAWADLARKKGAIASVLISPGHNTLQQALTDWKAGDLALLVHVYGGIGGRQAEPAVKAPLYFGHFAYGMATVVQEPLTDELRFDITYYQIYTHNSHGLIAGALHWSRYMGDRQWGILGLRPVCDNLVKFPPYTQPFDLDGEQHAALEGLIYQLETMAARYRIGDGSGGTYIGPANNCAQDSNQALYASIKRLADVIASNQDYFNDWQQRYPNQADRYQQLLSLRQTLQKTLLPFGGPRADWADGKAMLGSTLEEYPLKTIGRGLVSWRTMLPRVASNTVTKAFLDQGAVLWVLNTYQVGGEDPDIEPIEPLSL